MVDIKDFDLLQRLLWHVAYLVSAILRIRGHFWLGRCQKICLSIKIRAAPSVYVNEKRWYVRNHWTYAQFSNVIKICDHDLRIRRCLKEWWRLTERLIAVSSSPEIKFVVRRQVYHLNIVVALDVLIPTVCRTDPPRMWFTRGDQRWSLADPCHILKAVDKLRWYSPWWAYPMYGLTLLMAWGSSCRKRPNAVKFWAKLLEGGKWAWGGWRDLVEIIKCMCLRHL